MTTRLFQGDNDYTVLLLSPFLRRDTILLRSVSSSRLYFFLFITTCPSRCFMGFCLPIFYVSVAPSLWNNTIWLIVRNISIHPPFNAFSHGVMLKALVTNTVMIGCPVFRSCLGVPVLFFFASWSAQDCVKCYSISLLSFVSVRM